jgi:glycosidase
LKLYFTSNHDENSWNKADYLTMPGVVHAPFAVLTQTLNHSVPLIYSGQEEPLPDNLSFFEKDTIYFSKFQRSFFYTTLLQLRKNSPALAANASFKKINTGNDKDVYAFVREAGGQKILVLVNLSPKSQAIAITDQSLLGSPENVFIGKPENVTNQPRQIEPWGYLVYRYQ